MPLLAFPVDATPASFAVALSTPSGDLPKEVQRKLKRRAELQGELLLCRLRLAMNAKEGMAPWRRRVGQSIRPNTIALAFPTMKALFNVTGHDGRSLVAGRAGRDDLVGFIFAQAAQYNNVAQMEQSLIGAQPSLSAYLRAPLSHGMPGLGLMWPANWPGIGEWGITLREAKDVVWPKLATIAKRIRGRAAYGWYGLSLIATTILDIGVNAVVRNSFPRDLASESWLPTIIRWAGERHSLTVE
ncbi:hypothetical protein BDZ90DRAFT_228780 [Jaminaea rosea]|uniref:Uncharacterized protein n=1 Tax=Jaminaea rosea TaxID=1569628 RepID=A0A316UN16_9BASI|nr:hypothetical protein BDZ90DRAFT_228780 [Jaminaea rosea]PWN24555.1 hypothetical protein BDZ90DRAFT_228780 [Jaminaea rosea]